jgi:Ca-activated chloride channel homolog
MPANSERDREPSGDLDLTSYALGQLDEAERAAIERQLSEANGDGRAVEQTRQLAEELRAALSAENPAASSTLRDALLHRLGDEAADDGKPQPAAKPQSAWRRRGVELVAAALVLSLVAVLLLPAGKFARHSARQMLASNDLQPSKSRPHVDDVVSGRSDGFRGRESGAADRAMQERYQEGLHTTAPNSGPLGYSNHKGWLEADGPGADPSFAGTNPSQGQGDGQAQPNYSFSLQSGISPSPGDKSGGGEQGGGQVTPFYSVVPHDLTYRADGQQSGAGQQRIRGGQGQGVAPNDNYQTFQRLGGRRDGLPIGTDYGTSEGIDPRAFGTTAGMDGGLMGGMMGMAAGPGSEQYAPIVENAFIQVQGIDALSTFSIDVDTASYANVRRFLTQGQLPPPNAVRIEELVNYFSYDYPQPKAGEPFSVNMEVAECPWQQKHLLLRVGLKGREIHHNERPVSNLVFLLDVSGSMADENKLPLLKQVLSMMVRELREDDRVSIVTYAGEAGLRLPPTTGNEQAKILAAIDSLSSGGSTNGSAGIELAYEQAQAYFRKEGTNRVILATDGDLNVGITDDESLVQLIKQKASGGTFLTVLGFGEGNLKDAKMERLADNGNGLYAYIDSVREGRKVLVEQMSGSLVTIAKDVKIQIEFNPQEVQAYRLLGYENRMLTAPEFADDRRDAGEIGAGHSVTALYELVPAAIGPEGNPPQEQPSLRYQTGKGIPAGVKAQEGKLSEAASSGELLTLKLRYKEPDGMASKLSEHPLANRGGKFNAATKDFQFAAAVVSFGMQLRNSKYRGEGNLAATAEIAAGAIGEDKGGYRAEFLDLVRKAQKVRPAATGVNADY